MSMNEDSCLDRPGLKSHQTVQSVPQILTILTRFWWFGFGLKNLLPKLPQKIRLTSKVVKGNFKKCNFSLYVCIISFITPVMCLPLSPIIVVSLCMLLFLGPINDSRKEILVRLSISVY